MTADWAGVASRRESGSFHLLAISPCGCRWQCVRICLRGCLCLTVTGGMIGEICAAEQEFIFFTLPNQSAILDFEDLALEHQLVSREGP